MKRILINTAFLALLAGGISSCKKQIADSYLNPDLTSTGSLSKLMSGMFFNPRIHPSYYDFATFIMPTTAAFSQLTALSPTTLMYVPSINYNEARWDHYYDGSMPNPGQGNPDYNYNGPGILSNYREMQTTYAALSPADQAKQMVFMQCAKVVLYDQTAQMIDLWGDIPFSKANSLNTASRSISSAPFDNAAALYDTLIAGLKDLNTWFASATLQPEIQSTFTQQDIVLGGSLKGWQQYANSLRLRLLMRISYFDATTAQSQVTAMLADPNTYPLITDNKYNVLFTESPTPVKSDIHDALTSSPYAPAYLLDTIMVANGDPRTAILWDSVQGQPYKGFPSNGSVSDYQNGGYATYDSATFFYNYNVPGVIFTAAEVSFLTAEANERWGAGSTPAATAYANGIAQSTAFYYGIYQSRVPKQGYAPPANAILTMPTATDISNYVSKVPYTGSTQHKLSLIATQNWINFFILQAGQAWAEIRRTGYPQLSFATGNYSGATTPPARLLYPASEKLYNATNYGAVSGKDTRDTKIFWDVN
jgi:hypothetical protein